MYREPVCHLDTDGLDWEQFVVHSFKKRDAGRQVSRNVTVTEVRIPCPDISPVQQMHSGEQRSVGDGQRVGLGEMASTENRLSTVAQSTAVRWEGCLPLQFGIHPVRLGPSTMH